MVLSWNSTINFDDTNWKITIVLCRVCDNQSELYFYRQILQAAYILSSFITERLSLLATFIWAAIILTNVIGHSYRDPKEGTWRALFSSELKIM